MTRFPLTTGYAIEALACLAIGGDRTMRIAEISGITNIPSPYLSKIFQRLGEASIIEAKRGHKGGVRLLKPPRDITIREIDAALAGERRDARCAPATPRPLTFWESIHDSYRDKLAAMTLEEVITYQTRPAS